ncbi:WD domain repeat-containing protein 55 [Basidiobolus ranarum]|uniref:WD repeat-containing protein JIP5 n=1 Tax=Basidiobolus ranarum TaxID=34480 RepID=A0ABR2VPQ2_9FUNG
MVKINEDIICTGSSDGLIRVVQIHPNKLLGVVGEHDDFPVEQIRLSHDNQYMGSCAHDQTVKFWNIGYLFDEDDDDEEEIEAEETEQQIELDQAPLDTESVEQMEEPKDSDNSDIEPEENNKRKKKQREKKEKKLPANFDIETSAAVDFFSDL